MGTRRFIIRNALWVSLIYFLLILIIFVRYPPFYDANPYDIYRRIAVGYYEFPENISIPARQLIAGFLEQDLSKRLGCLSGGAEDIKNNSWFIGVDWNIVQQKRIQPPWIPELTSDSDYQYFDQYPDSGNDL